MIEFFSLLSTTVAIIAFKDAAINIAEVIQALIKLFIFHPLLLITN